MFGTSLAGHEAFAQSVGRTQNTSTIDRTVTPTFDVAAIRVSLKTFDRTADATASVVRAISKVVTPVFTTAYSFIKSIAQSKGHHGRGRIDFVGQKKANYPSETALTIDLTSGFTGGTRDHVEYGDLVIVAMAQGWNGDAGVSVTTSGYTEQANLFRSDGRAINLGVSTKTMGETPDTSVTTNALNFSGAGSVVIFVYSGVDAATPMDVTVVTGSNNNTRLVDPPAITPNTPNAVVVVAGATGVNSSFTAFPSLSNVMQQNDTGSTWGCVVAVGDYSTWTPAAGALDLGAWSFSGGDSSSDAYCVVVMALQPGSSTVPTKHRQFPVTLDRAASGISSLVRQAAKIIIAAVDVSPAITRSIGKIIGRLIDGVATAGAIFHAGTVETPLTIGAETTPQISIVRSTTKVLTKAADVTVAYVLQSAKAIIVEAGAVASVARQSIAALFIAALGSAAIAKQAARIANATSDVSAAAIRLTGRMISSSVEVATILVRRTSRFFDQSASAGASLLRGLGKQITRSAQGVASYLRNINRTIGRTVSGIATARRRSEFTMDAASAVSATVRRSIVKALTFLAEGNAALSRAVDKAASAASGASATCSRVLTKIRRVIRWSHWL